MTLVFDHSEYLNLDIEPAFNAVFINQSSYISLLDLVYDIFNIPIRDPNCDMPCMSQAYMIISSKREKIKYGIGKSVSLKIKSLFYNSKVKVVLAIVKLKNNFTDFPVPYIIISKPEGINGESIDKIILKHHSISLEILQHNTFIELQESERATVHGKVGIYLGESDSLKDYQDHQGHKDYKDYKDHQQHEKAERDNVVTRPEVTLSVDNCAPPIKQQLDHSEEEKAQKEFYMGLEVFKGSRGGKYVIKDGKKKYVSDAEIASASKKSETVVYNVNLLAPDIKKPYWRT